MLILRREERETKQLTPIRYLALEFFHVIQATHLHC